jgi:hypothetical protein
MGGAKSDLSNLIGRKIGRLTVKDTWIDSRRETHYCRWILTDCDCGTTNHLTRYAHSGRRQAQSCGCLLREARAKWGRARRRVPPEYQATRHYFGVLTRRQGKINVLWETHLDLIADMGPKPEGKVLVRDDPNLPFCKSNCSLGWLSRKAARMANPKTPTRMITVNGVTHGISEWARLAGISRQAFYNWLSFEELRRRGKPHPKERTDEEIAAYLLERINHDKLQPVPPQSKARDRVRSRG